MSYFIYKKKLYSKNDDILIINIHISLNNIRMSTVDNVTLLYLSSNNLALFSNENKFIFNFYTCMILAIDLKCSENVERF